MLHKTINWTGKCATNGCDSEVTRILQSDPRFCPECRKQYGRNVSESISEQISLYRAELPNRYLHPVDHIGRRLAEGYRLMKMAGD